MEIRVYLRLLLLIMVLAIPGRASAGDGFVAVLELTGDLDPRILMKISDEARTGTRRVLSKADSDLDVMTRENMEVFLEAQGIDLSCVEGNCEVETGQNLQASYVMSGSVIEVDGVWIITLKLHETQGTGQFLDSQDARGRSKLEAIDATHDAAATLIANALELDVDLKNISKLTVGEGWLSVFTDPDGLNLLVDGNTVGQTPVSRLDVAAGEHTIEIEDDCYSSGGAWVVDVAPNLDRQITLDVAQRTTKLSVEVTDEQGREVEAHLRIDNEPAGKTPITVDASICAQRLSVANMGGGGRATAKLDLQEGEHRVVKLKVEASQQAGPTGKGGRGGRKVQVKQGVKRKAKGSSRQSPRVASVHSDYQDLEGLVLMPTIGMGPEVGLLGGGVALGWRDAKGKSITLVAGAGLGAGAGLMITLQGERYRPALLLGVATIFGYPEVVLGAIVEHDAFDAGGIGCRYGLSVTESEEVIPSLSISYAL